MGNGAGVGGVELVVGEGPEGGVGGYEVCGGDDLGETVAVRSQRGFDLCFCREVSLRSVGIAYSPFGNISTLIPLSAQHEDTFVFQSW